MTDLPIELWAVHQYAARTLNGATQLRLPPCKRAFVKRGALQAREDGVRHTSNLLRRIVMAHKKIERKKELDRKRHRREQRLKARIKEAKAAKA